MDVTRAAIFGHRATLVGTPDTEAPWYDSQTAAVDTIANVLIWLRVEGIVTDREDFADVLRSAELHADVELLEAGYDPDPVDA